MKKFLITMAADITDKYNGVNVFFKSLLTNYHDIESEWNIIVLTPSNFPNGKLCLNWKNDDIKFIKIKSNKFESIYLYKTIIVKFIEDYCDYNDEILYLDYDHICFSQFTLPKLKGDELFVSSETHIIPMEKIGDFTSSNIKNSIFFLHFNTSFVYSTASNFLQATNSWIDVGQKLFNSTQIRNSEEIAFSISVNNSGLKVIPISEQIQANWTHLVNSPLFHYGGETEMAISLKKLLNESNKRKYQELLHELIRESKEKEDGLLNILSFF